MSLSIFPISKILRTTDPRLDMDEGGIMVVNESATKILYQKYPASNFAGNTIVFNTIQSPTQVISVKAFVECEFEVILSGNPDPGTTLYQLGNDAPRFMPLAAVTSNAVLQINGTSTSIQTNFFNDALFRYSSDYGYLAKDLSGTPSMFDYYQQYVDYTQFGSGLNALAGIGEAGPGIEPRGGFPISVDATDVNNVKIRFVTYEPVIIPPMNWGHDNTKGLIGVKTLNLTYNLENLSRVWSRRETNGGLVTVSASIVRPPQLCLITMSPKLSDKIPNLNIYPYGQIVSQNQSLGNINAGASIRMSFNAQQLSGVPSRIYFYAKRTNKTAKTTDTFCRIENFNIQFDNETGILSGAVPQQLYTICAENGYQGSFSDWYKYSGGVMCVDFRKDIPMNEYMAVGTSKNITFRFDCDVTNIGSVNESFTFYTIIVYEGVMTIDNQGGAYQQINILGPGDVLNNKQVQHIPYHAVKNFLVEGGSLFSRIGQVGRTAKKLAKKAIDTYEGMDDDKKKVIGELASDALDVVSPRLANFARDLAPGAFKIAKKLVGEGYSEDQIYKILAEKYGGKRKPAIGGRKLTKAELMKIAKGSS